MFPSTFSSVLQGVDIEGDSQLEALGSGQVQLQELNLEQNSQFGLQNLAGVDGKFFIKLSSKCFQ